MRWLLAVFSAALVTATVQAGTNADPEITDPASDPVFTGAPSSGAPSCLPVNVCFSRGLDVLNVWVANETGTDFHILVDASGPPGSISNYDATYTVHFALGSKQYTATAAQAVGSENWTVSGAASAAEVNSGGELGAGGTPDNDILDLTIQRSKVGNPIIGDKLSSFYLDALGNPQGAPTGPIADRAPDDPGFGREYTFTLATSANATAPSATTTTTTATTATTTLAPPPTTSPSTTTATTTPELATTTTTRRGPSLPFVFTGLALAALVFIVRHGLD